LNIREVAASATVIHRERSRDSGDEKNVFALLACNI
jgi:hypothetical protein